MTARMFFGYHNLLQSTKISMGINADGVYEVSVSDGSITLTADTTVVAGNKEINHIGVLRKSAKTIDFNYYDSSLQYTATDTDAAFEADMDFNNAKFRIGCIATPPAANINFLDGDVQELITYARKLTDEEVSQIVTYLNNKYKIY